MPKRKAEEEVSEEDIGSEDSELSEDEEASEEEEDSLVTSEDDDGDAEEGDGEGEEGEDGDESDEEGAEKTIDVDFEFFDPTENDFHALKILLTNYLDGKQFASSDLVDAVIKQGSAVGTVIKSGEEEDAWGVGSLLPLKSSEGSTPKYIADLKKFLLDGAASKTHQKAVAAAFTSDGTALLLAERVMNLAPQLAAPLVEGLLEEAKEANLEFKAYLTVTRVFEDLEKAGTYMHATPDGECMEKHSEWKYVVPVSNRPAVEDEGKAFRMVMLVKADKMPAVVEELKQLKMG